MPDKPDSHKGRCHALYNDKAAVCQHTNSNMVAKSHYLHNWSRRCKIENNLRYWK
jgi:hypothetical protein